MPIYQTARRHVSGTHLSVNDHSFSPNIMYLMYFVSTIRYCQYLTVYNIRLRMVHEQCPREYVEGDGCDLIS